MFNFGDDPPLNVETKKSGFLLSKPADSQSPHFFKTTRTGFETDQKQSTLQTCLLNQWTNGKKLLSWEYYDLYFNGKHITLDIDGWILAAAISANNKIVVLTADFKISFFTMTGALIATDSDALSSITSIVGNNQQDPCRPCFNHNATKLVFIGKNATTSAKDLPFDSTLINPNLGDYIATGTGFPNSDSVGTHSSAAVDVDEKKQNWQAVYRINIDTANNSASIFSMTEQYAEHVYKVTNTTTSVYSGVADSSYGLISNKTSSVAALHDDPFISYIGFDKNGTEKTEISTSLVELSITEATSNTRTQVITDTIQNEEYYSYSRTIHYKLQSISTSDLGILKEELLLDGSSERNFSNIQTIFYENHPPTATFSFNDVGDNTESRSGEHIEIITGFNKYINNLFVEKFACSANSVSVPNGAITLTFDIEKTLDADVNPFSIAAVNSGNVLSVTGAITNNTNITSDTDERPIIIPAPRNETETITTENFIFITPKSLNNADNYFVNALADKYGNMLYSLNYESQEGVKAYKKNFVSESVGKQAEIAAIVNNISNIKGVI